MLPQVTGLMHLVKKSDKVENTFKTVKFEHFW